MSVNSLQVTVSNNRPYADPMGCMHMQKKVPIQLIQKIGSYLEPKEQGRLTQVACFTRDAAHETESYYKDLKEQLSMVIADLPVDPKEFQELLAKILASPSAGDPKNWVPVIDALMNVLAEGKTVDEIFHEYTVKAHLLKTLKKPISSAEMYLFCNYLKRSLAKINPWIGYRVLEQYSLDSTAVSQAMKEYLTQVTKTRTSSRVTDYTLPNKRRLKVQRIVICPRVWFGYTMSKQSLWYAPNGESVPMPKLLIEVLWERIQYLRASYPELPCEVGMMRRAESRFPQNFTLELARRITNANIFLDHNDTLDIEKLENKSYGTSFDLTFPEDEEREQFALEHYPNAIVPHNEIC